MKKIFHKKPVKTSTAQKDPRMEMTREERRLTMKKYGRKLKKKSPLSKDNSSNCDA